MTYKNITHDSLKARMHRIKRPGTGFCGRCGMPWGVVEGHTTWYESKKDGQHKKGMFPLCEGCWELLGSPEARIEYYRDLVEYWEKDLGFGVDPEFKHDITRAVANGG